MSEGINEKKGARASHQYFICTENKGVGARGSLFREYAEFSRNIKPAKSKVNTGERRQTAPPNNTL